MSKRTDRFRSSDGLMESSDPAAVALWESIGARMEDDKRNWTQRLRDAGIKLAHPDDGWVNRDRNTFSLSWYAQFNDSPQVGDLVAFGTPPDGDHYEPRRSASDQHRRTEYHKRPINLPESANSGYRVCRVTAVEDRTGILGRHVTYAYEDTGMRLPPQAPRRALFWRILGWRS